MDYIQAVHYIEEIPKYTRKTSLEHTRILLDKLGNPEKDRKIIHVAGTNGKGSVCAYLNSMLMEGGYKVGLFTSPHLIRINERFQINSRPVGDEEFLEAFQEVTDVVKKAREEGLEHPTYFEFLFLMGILIFRRENTDYCVLEVGMGGRLDATNVISRPLACIIASISIDHEEYLGHTITSIAEEKAGIIKPLIPVIYDGHNAEASAVIAAKAREKGSPAYALLPEMYRIVRAGKEGITFDFFYRPEECERLTIPYIAEYQMMNAALAYFTMKKLEAVHKIPADKLKEGIRKMAWPCRMETVMDGVIIDGAHNEDGIAQFVKTAARFHQDSQITVLFSAVSDKRYPDMVREIAEGIRPERVVATTIPGSREVPEDELAELFRRNGCSEVYEEKRPQDAFEKAYSLKGNGMLFCVGSLYLAGILKDWISRRTEEDHVKF